MGESSGCSFPMDQLYLYNDEDEKEEEPEVVIVKNETKDSAEVEVKRGRGRPKRDESMKGGHIVDKSRGIKRSNDDEDEDEEDEDEDYNAIRRSKRRIITTVVKPAVSEKKKVNRKKPKPSVAVLIVTDKNGRDGTPRTFCGASFVFDEIDQQDITMVELNRIQSKYLADENTTVKRFIFKLEDRMMVDRNFLLDSGDGSGYSFSHPHADVSLTHVALISHGFKKYPEN